MPWKLMFERFGVARLEVESIDVSGPCHFFVEQVIDESAPAGNKRARGTIDLRQQQPSSLEPGKSVEALVHLGDVELKVWAIYLDEAELLDFGSFDAAAIDRLIASQRRP